MLQITNENQPAIAGHQHLSQKDLQILNLILNQREFEDMDNWVHSIVFRSKSMVSMMDLAGGKKDMVFGSTAFDTRSIMINLADIFQAATESAMEFGGSIQAYYHHLLLDTVLHELHHLKTYAKDGKVVSKLGDKGFLKIFEKAAEDWAEEKLLELVKEYDLEPAPIDNCPYLNSAIKELLGNEDDQDEFIVAQRELIAENLFLWRKETADKKELKIDSFKSFLHSYSGDDFDDEEWQKPSNGLPSLSASLQAQGLVKEVPEPETKTVSAAGPPVIDKQGQLVDDQPYPETSYQLPETNYTDPNEYNAYGPVEMNPVPEPQFYEPEVPVFQPDEQFQPQQPQPQQQFQPQPQLRPKANTPVDTTKLPPEANAVIAVYYKVYQKVFAKAEAGGCGPNVLKRLDPNKDYVAFQNPEAVKAPIPLYPNEQSQVIGYDTQTRGSQQSSENGIIGYVTSKSCIPNHIIHRADPSGKIQRRLLIPQNPNARKNNELTATAKQARNGDHIMYIKDADTEEWLLKIVNGTLMHG
jgi:hypothetical protein